MESSRLSCSCILLMVLSTIYSHSLHSANHVVNLNVQYTQVNITGTPRKAITVNNQIPAPTLHFKEGDTVTINVTNQLNVETAIHWHGLLVPWQMDGVLGISQKGIPPGGQFQYRFTLYQSGTYWYHAHAELQEQQGLYGAFVIDPQKAPPYHYDKDEVIVLSDWSNTEADHILANLKKDGDYYAPKFPLQASLAKFLRDYHKASADERPKLIDDYKMMQQMRMGLYDFSDVAYDAFLLNGHPKSRPWKTLVKVGDVVRLRFIGAGGSTIFKVKIPNSTMQVVHVDGNDIAPQRVDSFSIAPGETYDVLVTIQKHQPYIIYAESLDTLGEALGALITAPGQSIPYKKIASFPEPLPVTRDMMALMMSTPSSKSMDDGMSMDHSMHGGHSMPMNHSMHGGHDMSMPTEPSIIGDTLSATTHEQAVTFGSKYQNLKAINKTNNPDKPVDKLIKMELFGYMDKYIWFINGIPEHLAKPIVLEPNKRYRFVFTNPSMMHHPMHIHGHWFILRNGNKEYDPLLHTLDIPPGATVTADVDTDASGQWIFHCHLLYHMMSGMARVIQYSTLIELSKAESKPEHIIKQTGYYNRPIVRVDKEPIDHKLVHHPMAHTPTLYLANFLDLGADPFHQFQKLSFKGLYGKEYNRIELTTKDAEMKQNRIENADLDVFYWHLLNQFWAIKGGVNYFFRPSQKPYWQPGIGIEGLMPYFIDTDLRAYVYNSSVKLDAEFGRDTQITNNLFLRTSIRGILATKTVNEAEIGNGLNQVRYTIRPYYRLMPGVSIFTEFEHEQDYGVFKTLQLNNNEATTEDTVTFGLSMLF